MLGADSTIANLKWMKPLPFRLLIAGVIVTLGAPMVGLIGTVLGMVEAFSTLGSNGISDPKVLSGSIGVVLTSTMAGLIIAAVVGLPLIITGVILLARRKRLVTPPAS